MGWYFQVNGSRKDIIEECTGNSENDRVKYETLAHRAIGNTLWAVHQSTVKETGVVTRFIGCYLLAKRRGEGYGYKPMDETMGPCQYNCPLSYLEMAQPAPEGQFVQPWRDSVREYHAEQAPKNELKKSLKVGDHVILGGCAAPWEGRVVEVETTKGKTIKCRYIGMLLRVQKKHIAGMAQDPCTVTDSVV